MTFNANSRASTRQSSPLYAPSGSRLDATDIKILCLLQTRARDSIQNIAQRIKLSHSGTLHRLRRLEGSGAVLRYMAELDASLFQSWPVTWIDIALTRQRADARLRFEQAISQAPEVLEAIECVGEFDLSLKVALRNAADWPALKSSLDPQAEFIERARLRPVARVVKYAVPHPLLTQAVD